MHILSSIHRGSKTFIDYNLKHVRECVCVWQSIEFINEEVSGMKCVRICILALDKNIDYILTFKSLDASQFGKEKQ